MRETIFDTRARKRKKIMRILHRMHLSKLPIFEISVGDNVRDMGERKEEDNDNSSQNASK